MTVSKTAQTCVLFKAIFSRPKHFGCSMCDGGPKTTPLYLLWPSYVIVFEIRPETGQNPSIYFLGPSFRAHFQQTSRKKMVQVFVYQMVVQVIIINYYLLLLKPVVTPMSPTWPFCFSLVPTYLFFSEASVAFQVAMTSLSPLAPQGLLRSWAKASASERWQNLFEQRWKLGWKTTWKISMLTQTCVNTNVNQIDSKVGIDFLKASWTLGCASKVLVLVGSSNVKPVVWRPRHCFYGWMLGLNESLDQQPK